ncbi:MAG: SMP-30/gluconolactonase/LRE family protein [Rhodospirillum sp.]|nr:SMP-30/gluconolactonase/LRE family protein [Rhodospirillum sp.]MCF8491026.1 SMP-30/gluconolactonase/LRE family protein [Rhodospirillum sp.]
MVAMEYDQRVCALGEGPLWHPLRNQLFWFDILSRRMLSRSAEGAPLSWAFEGMASAAGWVDKDRLVVASETALFLLDLRDGSQEELCGLEGDDPGTRSNDGRADPWGGFWIGTMGKTAERERGALYRWFQGRLVRLRDGMTIPNAICFAPDRSVAYYGDTGEDRIYRQPLDDEGWPDGTPDIFLDLGPEGLHPDGAVVDSEGCLWNAQWGAGRVARYAPDGRFLQAIALPSAQTTCPAFGGRDLRTLFVTSAREGDPADGAGQTWRVENSPVAGVAEPAVLLGEGAQ